MKCLYVLFTEGVHFNSFYNSQNGYVVHLTKFGLYDFTEFSESISNSFTMFATTAFTIYFKTEKNEKYSFHQPFIDDANGFGTSQTLPPVF